MSALLRGVLVTSILASGAGAEEPRVLADFPESLATLQWRVVNDDVMGGRSEGGFRLEKEWLVFEGTTNTRGGGFSSIRSATGRFDLEEEGGIRLRVRGDGRTYTFGLTTSDTRGGRIRPSFWADFPTREGAWEVIDVPFRRFRPRWRGQWLEGPDLNPGAIDSLGLMISDERDGPFRLEVDWIQAYREPRAFSIGAYRGSKRPLLLFAKDAGDERLRRQLSAVEATRDRFDERDMVLIVVLDAGPSRVEGQPLAAEDAARLRAAYAVEGGAFAVRLVGKDGGVKRSGRDVVSMDALYAQIDSMPMRQEEMRRP
jgi:NADH dehydrogenase [ubiquinone] 1 alpha subcomplex assembly factor 1